MQNCGTYAAVFDAVALGAKVSGNVLRKLGEGWP